MSNLFAILEISKRALLASQMGVRIANHNISNLNNPDHTRQRLLLSPSSYLAGPVGELGNGVDVQGVRRMTDRFLLASLRREYTQYNGWLQKADVLASVEGVLGTEEENPLAAAVSEFFSAYADLAQNVEDGALRRVVVNKAASMCRRFQETASELDKIREDINAKIATEVEEVNSLLAEIADLNERIVARETGRGEASDLRDRRDGLLKELSSYLTVEVREDEEGAVEVYAVGKNLVRRGDYFGLRTEIVEAGNGPGTELFLGLELLPAENLGGSLGSLLEVREGEVASVRRSLDELAASIIAEVNSLHSQGHSPAGSGIDFFTGSSAADIDVSATLMNNPDYVATSYDGTAGDNSLANDIAALQDSVLTSLGGKSFGQFMAELVGEMASAGADARQMADLRSLTTSQIQARLESVSGVSLDEEMTMVAQYQAAYSAAANVVGTIKEMMETVLALGVQ